MRKSGPRTAVGDGLSKVSLLSLVEYPRLHCVLTHTGIISHREHGAAPELLDR